MKLPQLTHLQAFVIFVLKDRKVSITSLKTSLKEYKEAREGSNFNQLMNRLTEKKLVKRSMKTDVFNGKKKKINYFKATAKGTKLFRESIEFYAKIIEKSPSVCPSNVVVV